MIWLWNKGNKTWSFTWKTLNQWSYAISWQLNPLAINRYCVFFQPPEDVSCVSWNRQVQHILASTFGSRCVVWDLRKNEPIIKVSDSMSRVSLLFNIVWYTIVPFLLGQPISNEKVVIIHFFSSFFFCQNCEWNLALIKISLFSF